MFAIDTCEFLCKTVRVDMDKLYLALEDKEASFKECVDVDLNIDECMEARKRYDKKQCERNW